MLLFKNAKVKTKKRKRTLSAGKLLISSTYKKFNEKIVRLNKKDERFLDNYLEVPFYFGKY